MDSFVVLFDACVLYPAPLRSFLMYLAMTELFEARWTNEIHDEWMRNVLSDYPDISRAKVERVRDLMNAHVPGCLVTDYESLIPNLNLPDANDRHVLAAAIHCHAAVIVTLNLKDFPDDVLNSYGIKAQHPDAFIAKQLAVAPSIVCAAAKRQRDSLKNPPKTVAEYLETLERQGLIQTVANLRQVVDSL